MKKIDVSEFVDLIEEELSSFKDEMITRNFSKRNQKKWFKMMGDYFNFTSDLLEEDDDDEDEDDEFDNERSFEKAKKRAISEYFWMILDKPDQMYYDLIRFWKELSKERDMEREKELLELIWYRCLDNEHCDEVPEDIIEIMKKYAAESGFDLPDDR